jgi:hypothetical protein
VAGISLELHPKHLTTKNDEIIDFKKFCASTFSEKNRLERCEKVLESLRKEEKLEKQLKTQIKDKKIELKELKINFLEKPLGKQEAEDIFRKQEELSKLERELEILQGKEGKVEIDKV